MEKSSFVPCSYSTGAPALTPVGEVIEIPAKSLRIYRIDPAQVRMIEEFYGLTNGHRQAAALFPPVITIKKKPARRKGRR